MTTEDEGLRRVLDAMVPTDEEKAAAVLVSALEDARAKAKAAAAEAKEPWTIDPLLTDVAADAVRVDPKNADRWLLLANRLGAVTVAKMLGGGVRSVRGLDAAEKAVDALLKRGVADAAWLGGVDATTLSDAPGRTPLLKYDGESWLPGGIVGLVVAGGGSGKTTWLAELALRVTCGNDWPEGLWTLARLGDTRSGVAVKGPALLVMAEEDRDGAAYQIARARRQVGYHKNEEPLVLWEGAGHDTALGEVVTFDDPAKGKVTTVVPSKFHDALCAKARLLGPLLVVLDPINQLLPAGGSENDAVTAGALIRLAGQIQIAAEEGRRDKGKLEGYPRPVVLMAHHVRKPDSKAGAVASGSEEARGSSAFTDNARWVCTMSTEWMPDKGRAQWAVTKSNYTDPATVLAKRRRDRGGIVWEPWTGDDTSEWEQAKATKPASAASAASAAATATGSPSRRALPPGLE